MKKKGLARQKFNAIVLTIVATGYVFLALYQYFGNLSPQINFLKKNTQQSALFLLQSVDLGELAEEVQAGKHLFFEKIVQLDDRWMVNDPTMAKGLGEAFDYTHLLTCQNQNTMPCMIGLDGHKEVVAVENEHGVVIAKLNYQSFVQILHEQFNQLMVIQGLVSLLVAMSLLYLRNQSMVSTIKDIDSVLNGKSSFSSIFSDEFKTMALARDKQEREYSNTIDAITSAHDSYIEINNEQLEHYQHELSHLRDVIAQNAHDMANAINVMSNNINIAQNKYPGVQAELATTKVHSDSLRLKIDNLLKLNAYEQSDAEISIGTIDLDSEMEQMLCIGRERKTDSVNLLVYCSANVPRFIKSYHIAINSILENLLVNALKYTHNGEVVCYLDYQHSYSNSGKLLITVEDSGIGMDEHEIKKVFGAYEQFDEYSKQVGGVGLGLNNVNRFCDMLNATKDIKSIKGKGTVFSIHFDIQSEALTLPVVQQTVHIHSKHVSVFNALSSRLQRLGYTIARYTENSDVKDGLLLFSEEYRACIDQENVLFYTAKYPAKDPSVISLCDTDFVIKEKLTGQYFESTSSVNEQNMANMAHEMKTNLHVINGMVELLPELPAILTENIDALNMSVERLLGKEAIGRCDVVRLIDRFIDQQDKDIPLFVGMDVAKQYDISEYQLRRLLQQMHSECEINEIIINAAKNMAKFDVSIECDVNNAKCAKQKAHILQALCDEAGCQLNINNSTVEFVFVAKALVKRDSNKDQVCIGGTNDKLRREITCKLMYLGFETMEWFDDEEALENSEFKSYFKHVVWAGEAQVLTNTLTVREDERVSIAKLEYELAQEQSKRAKRILVIDDIQDNIKLFQAMLNDSGHSLDSCLSAEEALDKNLAEYDIVFSDVNMGGISGVEMTKKIRARNIQTPIVLCTAGALSGQGLENLEDIHLLPKPFNKQEIRQMVSKVN